MMNSLDAFIAGEKRVNDVLTHVHASSPTAKRQLLSWREYLQSLDEDACAVAGIEERSETLDKIESALERIENGTFGTCDQCGEVLSGELLDETPYEETCAGCLSTEAVVLRIGETYVLDDDLVLNVAEIRKPRVRLDIIARNTTQQLRLLQQAPDLVGRRQAYYCYQRGGVRTVVVFVGPGKPIDLGHGLQVIVEAIDDNRVQVCTKFQSRANGVSPCLVSASRVRLAVE